MKKFYGSWARIWIYSMFKDKMDWTLEWGMRKLEINKRVYSLIEQRKKVKEKEDRLNQNRVKRKYRKQDLEKILEENYMLKMKEI